ncbi:hypothetical protein BD414DRAFT_491577 [Trametes punicea]|nr:hypothetical protein BD414DRAFT_491577 [Trametes punicea]
MHASREDKETLNCATMSSPKSPDSFARTEYIAQQVGQDRQAVELKLSQMILDKVFHGVLDQGRGCLLIFEQPEVDRAYGAAIDTLEQVGKVVDSLYAKTVKLA